VEKSYLETIQSIEAKAKKGKDKMQQKGE